MRRGRGAFATRPRERSHHRAFKRWAAHDPSAKSRSATDTSTRATTWNCSRWKSCTPRRRANARPDEAFDASFRSQLRERLLGRAPQRRRRELATVQPVSRERELFGEQRHRRCQQLGQRSTAPTHSATTSNRRARHTRASSTGTPRRDHRGRTAAAPERPARTAPTSRAPSSRLAPLCPGCRRFVDSRSAPASRLDAAALIGAEGIEPSSHGYQSRIFPLDHAPACSTLHISRAGVEPARPTGHRGLSAACLPFHPPGHHDSAVPISGIEPECSALQAAAWTTTARSASRPLRSVRESNPSRWRDKPLASPEASRTSWALRISEGESEGPRQRRSRHRTSSG